MNSDQMISLMLPDNNTYNFSVKNKEEVYYRQIAKEIKLGIPEEFLAVYDLKQNKVISKYFDKLDPNSVYRIFHLQKAASIIQSKDQEITKYKAEIQELKEKQKSFEIENQKIQLQSDAKVNELQEKLIEAEKQLQVGKDKIQAQRKDIESLQYDLKVSNSQQDVVKQDMIKKLQEKDEKCDTYAQQCQKYIKDIENLQNQQQLSRQNLYQVQEQFQLYQQQLSSSLQQWQQYSHQLESEKKTILLEKNKSDTEVKRLMKKIELLEEDTQHKITENTRLKREKASLQKELNSLQEDITDVNKQQEKLEGSLRKLQSDIALKEGELSQKNKEISQQKENLENLNQKLASKEREIQELQNRQNQQNKNEDSQHILILQEQVKQLNEQNNLYMKSLESVQSQTYELQSKLNQEQQQTNELQVIKENLEKKLKSFQEESKYKLDKKQQEIESQQQNLQNELNMIQQNLQEQIQKHEEDAKQWKEKEQNYESDIQKFKETLEKFKNEKIKFEEDTNKQRQDLLNRIYECDAQLYEKDSELVAIQNSAIVPVYQFRIQRLVEQVPREYFKDIEFAVETMMLNNVNPEKFLQDNQAKCQKLTFNMSQIQLNKARAEVTLYNISDQDYRRCADITNIGKITGIQCFVQVESDKSSLDRYYFFKCLECPNKKQFEGKIFGIKQCKNQDIEDLETKETAIDNCLSTIIAQDVMNKFVSELKEKKAENILEYKFREQYIIETTKDFKQVLSEQIQGQQLVLQDQGIKNYVEFIESLTGEQSNEFYDFTREYSTDRNQPADGNIIQAFLHIQNDKKLKDIYAKFNPDIIKKQLHHFIDFIGGNLKEMPQRLYYSIQEIEIKPNFQKYNGGHLKFDSSQEGKFLSAFTYYSIIKSQRQMCISHLQGVGDQLYNPLVSTYDGFLDKLDQGFNEIRTIESKFLSESNLNKGIDYMKALGIKWN
ncbi:unnamed protein product [Paramecium octaurelia]|uniref:Alpha-type protein kinase domain-containing protein n=1 Tax=Paramecium octaurelia TaxID=43137 RepID=A0A8S1URS1_PAROT|nr:unnamed protein product [Paramecium octaurelia]